MHETGLSRRTMLSMGAAGVALMGIGAAIATRRGPGEVDDDIDMNALLAAAPAPQRIAVDAPPDAEELETFLGPGFDARRDDVSSALERASAWSSRTGRPVRIEGVWQLRQPAILSHEGATFIFVNAELRARDDGRWVTTRFPNTLPIAVYVTAERVSLLGHLIVTGLGSPGKSYLQGLYLEFAHGAELGRITLRNMAIGVHLMCCDDVDCGTVDAYSMWGLQGMPEAPDGAGSAQVVSGCRRGRFGGLRSLRNDKSARYLSVGLTPEGLPRDNSANTFGPVLVHGRLSSSWSHATGVRSSRNSRFAGGIAHDVSYLVILQKYDTDDAYHIDGNTFGDWSGSIIDAAGSSVDAALQIMAAPDATTPVGRNSFGHVRATMAPLKPNWVQRMGYRLPGNFGLFVNSGETTIRSADFVGLTHHLHVESAMVEIGSLRSRRMARQPLRYGRGAKLAIGRYAILTDALGPGRDEALIGYVDKGTGAAPQVAIERVDVRGAMPAARTDFVAGEPPPGGSLEIGIVQGRMRLGTFQNGSLT